jgi:hypothetical protein
MAIRNHPEYEQGYAEGYNEGYNRALQPQIDAASKSSQPAVTVVAPTEVADAARSALANKVLETIEAVAARPENANQYDSRVPGVAAALRDLFKQEGIEL